MSSELEARKTPATAQELFAALNDSWVAMFGERPRKESLILLMSQWALETGHGKSMWCYNLGNVKARPTGSYDYCYFACNELLPTASARSMQAGDPEHAKIQADRADGNSWIWFYPKHVGCCFRAFRTLVEGAVDHLTIVNKRFSKAWPAVILGDVVGYSHALKIQGYYTADEAAYTRGVLSVFGQYYKTLADLQTKGKEDPFDAALYNEARSLTEFPISRLQDPFEAEESRIIYSPYSVWLETQVEAA